MKKVSALLLTAVLGSSMVFAGISGSVVTTFGYDLDSPNILGFNNDNSDVQADFSFTTEGESISEGDVHAEISANLTMYVDSLTQADATNVDFTIDDYDLSAKIVGPNWYVDITGADSVADYANDINADDDGDAFHDWAFDSSEADGVTVGYTYEEDKTVVVSLGAENDFTNDTYEDYLAIASPSYMLAEGLTVEAAVAVQKSTAKGSGAAGGLKVTLSDEEMGYSVVAATDMGYNYTADKFDIEASMEGTYSLATIEAYFATTATYNTDADTDDVTDYSFDLATGTNLLSAKVTLDLEEVAENVPVTVYAQFIGMDVTAMYDVTTGADVAVNTVGADDPFVAGGDYRMNAGADYTIAMDMASLAVGINGGIKFKKNTDWKIGGDLTYTPADSAYVATVGMDFFNAPKELAPTASIETTTLVNGATLTLEYDGSRFSTNGGTNQLGTIDLTCEIEL